MTTAARPRTRLLGVDYGTVRVGLAITDSELGGASFDVWLPETGNR